MYAVIFRATIDTLDAEYQQMVERLHELAFKQYGCLDFTATTEGDQEIAISYWPSEEHILAWKNDPLHKRAQALGKNRWYKSFRVQVVKVQRDYTV